ncbi:N-acetyltransferase [Salmonella enterica subsp. enterica serovar Choleraesuis]|nr:N-acetyltransferase [Salmonella enterica subsp. enterica serovar Choleraesuis]
MSVAAPVALTLRPITPDDDAAIASVIRQVSHECGLSADKGFTVADPTLDELSRLYSAPRSAYWVVEHEGQVIGGGGIAPLVGAKDDFCELQKMYFLPIARGQGLAARLALQAMAFARVQGFSYCYLETTGTLTRAIALYRKLGFEPLSGPLGNTGHVDCEVRMLKTL